MPLFTLGLNHRTAPLALRERLAFPPEELTRALGTLADEAFAAEAALLSTCNRTELYCQTDTPEAAADWLASQRRIALSELAPHLYTLPGEAAIRHVFRLACGLDSMVLGESQILGQLKDAARVASQAGTLGSGLHKLFEHSFAVAKTVRSQTAIGEGVISMAAACVQLAARVFERHQAAVLLVGAGEMTELCARHFASSQPRRLVIANRDPARAHALAARCGGEGSGLEALQQLAEFDVVVSATASARPLIEAAQVEQALRARRRRPMVMVDLAVPRDIAAEVARLSDVFLYTVDDLARIVNTGTQARQAAVTAAEAIITHQVGEYGHWLEGRALVPTIRSLREHEERLRQSELERARRMLARGDDPQAVLEAFGQALGAKLLHGPLHYLNEASGQGVAEAAGLVRRLYQLDPPSNPD